MVSFPGCWMCERGQEKEGSQEEDNFSEKYIMNMLIRMFPKQICFLCHFQCEREIHIMQMWRACMWVLDELLILLHHLKASLCETGEMVAFRSLGRETSASLSLEDFKSPESEYVMLRSLQAQEAWAGGKCGQSGFHGRNLSVKANKIFFCCCSLQ